MQVEKSFLVNAYMRYGEIQGYSNGILSYLEKNSIRPLKGQMLLVGRALSDLSIGDKLFTPNRTQIDIYSFHLYGKILDSVSAGYTCVMICSAVNEELREYKTQKLYPLYCCVQNIIAVQMYRYTLELVNLASATAILKRGKNNGIKV